MSPATPTQHSKMRHTTPTPQQPDSPSNARLLADVGGTNARFAYQAEPDAPITDVQVMACADYPTLQAAMRAYLDQCGLGRPGAAAIAIANPITGDQIRMTNHHWTFSQAAVKLEFGFAQLRLLNDFTALALALPDIPLSELRAVGSGIELADTPKALVGAGTGLGVSGLLPNGNGGWIALEGEGGHVTLSAATPRERRVMDGLVKKYGHASAERVCSGPGLLDTFHLLCEADGVAVNGMTSAAAVTNAALNVGQPQALEALGMLCALLGSVAGNLALTLGARGGVYIGGGVVPRLGAWFDTSPFCERFRSKGRFEAYLKDVPVWVIVSEQSPALLGAARALNMAHRDQILPP